MNRCFILWSSLLLFATSTTSTNASCGLCRQVFEMYDYCTGQQGTGASSNSVRLIDGKVGKSGPRGEPGRPGVVNYTKINGVIGEMFRGFEEMSNTRMDPKEQEMNRKIQEMEEMHQVSNLRLREKLMQMDQVMKEMNESIIDMKKELMIKEDLTANHVLGSPPLNLATAKVILEFNLLPKEELFYSRIEDFYNYTYDDANDLMIEDGGRDMYDNGNKIFISAPNYSRAQLRYERTYKSKTFSISSNKSYPFMATAFVRGGSWLKFEVESGTGADGSGNVIFYNGRGTTPNLAVSFTSVQVYGTSDPSICELYVLYTNLESSTLFNVTTDATNTDPIANRASITASDSDAYFVYILLSGSDGSSAITSDRVANVVRDIVSPEILTLDEVTQRIL